jgi:hypothetical protein
LVVEKDRVDFGHNGHRVAIRVVEAEVKAHRIEDVAEVAEMSEQTNWPARPPAGVGLHHVAHRLLQRQLRITQVVLTAKAGQGRSFGGPEPATGEDLVELLQVQIHEKEGIAEAMRDR